MWRKFAGLMGVLCAAATAAPGQQYEPTEESFPRWKQYLQQSAQEQRWQELSWHAVFWEGVQHARAQDRPILLWVMNGHPLGCT
jgi:hypothetical protein